jgi:hypothetical protein
MANHMSYATAMAIVAATVFACAALAAALGKERHGIDFEATT